MIDVLHFSDRSQMLGRPSRLPEIEVPDGGTVTEITQQTGDPDRYSVFLDGEFAFGLHAKVLLSSGLSRGSVLGRSECERLIRDDIFHRAWSRALDYLAHKARTTSEVRRRMTDIGAPDVVADRVVVRLAELGYLDDEAYARRYVDSRMRSRGYGPRRLLRELRRKGIQARIAEAAISGLDDDRIARTLEELALKALERYRRVDDERERRRKASAWLARRGYSYEAIRAALDRCHGS